MNTHYLQFFKKMEKIPWCLIKDYVYLQKTGYDNEIDIVAYSSDRDKIRAIGRSLGWYESTLNNLNTHLIFFKFISGKPFRVDIHLDKLLATAVPWLSAEEILRYRVKKGNMWVASPAHELAVLILASLRGRAPKKHRLQRAKELRKHLGDVKEIISQMDSLNIDRFYKKLIKGEVIRFSKLQRLGVSGIVKEWVLLFCLFISRLFHLSPVYKIDDRLQKAVIQKLRSAKINATTGGFFKRIMSDMVFASSGKEIKGRSVDVIIKEIYPLSR